MVFQQEEEEVSSTADQSHSVEHEEEVSATERTVEPSSPQPSSPRPSGSESPGKGLSKRSAEGPQESEEADSTKNEGKWWGGLLGQCLLGLNYIWPSDAICRRRTGSTLAQVMACCLTASSHYLNQCWLISKVQWQHRTVSQEMPSITELSLEITYLTLHSDVSWG